MPKYKVMGDGLFGEGWKTGDIIEMDTHAAEVRVHKGELEEVKDTPKVKPVVLAKAKKAKTE